MGQDKLGRFEAIRSMPNVREHPSGTAGTWRVFFGNQNPITLELACGKGEYSVGLGRLHPHRNFLGVDIKGNRIYIGARAASEEGLTNVGFVRTQIDHLSALFAPGEVAEIWIVFPDPFLRKSRIKNRLTHPRFLRQYEKVLAPGGLIHFKTDSPELYEYTLEIIAGQGCILHARIDDVDAAPAPPAVTEIQTYYEGLHRRDGRTIRYLSFSLPPRGVQLPQRFLAHEQQRA